MDLMNKSKYYWINKASRYHQQRMLSLAPAQELAGSVRGVKDTNYMKFSHSVIERPEEGRIFEFLIEYDIYNPSQGIYFGCKSVTLPGFSHDTLIRMAIEEWEQIRPFALQRLNNVFVNKDFTHRFRQTDNAHNGTFWPFWISLYEDEDPREVGCRCLDIISGVYKDFFAGLLPESRPIFPEEKSLKVETAFTFEAFENLEQTVKKNIRKKTSDASLPDVAWRIISGFFDFAEQKGWFSRVAGYEMAWAIDDKFGDVDFYFIIKHLFDKLEIKLNIGRLSPPWGALTRLFLRKNGTPYKIQIKTLKPAPHIKSYWRNKLGDII